LERGDVLYFSAAPFALPQGDDLLFLHAQRLARLSQKAISYDPGSGAVSGHDGPGRERLAALLAGFARGVQHWLAQAFPAYAAAVRPDRVSFRPAEEATRRLRLTARNDLLHLDAFPNRPSWGDRILRVFANVDSTDSRVWVTSEPFAVLLERYGTVAGLPGSRVGNWFGHLGWGALRALGSARRARCPYDAFMLRLHDYLKRSEEFQERGRKRLWHFPPGSAWMAFTDACSYGELRGRFALEHSFFIRPDGLLLPDEAPAALLQRFCAADVQPRAA
jgi:hypothetical protein